MGSTFVLTLDVVDVVLQRLRLLGLASGEDLGHPDLAVRGPGRGEAVLDPAGLLDHRHFCTRVDLVKLTRHGCRGGGTPWP